MKIPPCLIDDETTTTPGIIFDQCGDLLTSSSTTLTWTDSAPAANRIYRVLINGQDFGYSTANQFIDVSGLPTDGSQIVKTMTISDDGGANFTQVYECACTAHTSTQQSTITFDQCDTTLTSSNATITWQDTNPVANRIYRVLINGQDFGFSTANQFIDVTGLPVDGSQITKTMTYSDDGGASFQVASECTCTAHTSVTTTEHTLTPLIREFPGYGGEALNDSDVTSVYFMENLNSSGAGSIAGAPSNAYVVPLVAGKIISNSRITLPQSNIRFLGQLAPGHLSINGTTTFNSQELVVFAGSNALWEYFTIRCSDNPTNVALTGSHGPFSVYNGINGSLSGVVLSHLSVHYGSDDSGSVFYDSQNITLYRLLSGHGITTAPVGGKSDNGILLGGGSNRITFFQNLLRNSGRSPLIQEVELAQAVNTLVYHTSADSTSNQIYGINTGGRPAVNQKTNFHDNLEIRFNGTVSAIWTGQGGGSTLDLYANNNQYKDCSNTFINMGFRSTVANVGNRNAPKHAMPELPRITDLTQLQSYLLPRSGNHICSDEMHDDVINTVANCLVPAVERTASDYFANPWPVGPSKPALTIWDQSSPDGLSDAAKEACGIAPGTNLLSPNDGRWEGVVDFHSGGLLSESIQ